MYSRRVPLENRKRTEISCDKCKTRKQKCNKPLGEDTCRYCQTRGIPCVTTQVRKYRVFGGGGSGDGSNIGGDSSNSSNGARMGLLECLVKGLIPEADLSSNEGLRELARSLGIPVPPSLQGDESSGGETQNEKGFSTPLTQDERLLQDTMQGRVQYIGPGSSYFFMMKLRTLFGRSGPNTQSELCLTLGNSAEIGNRNEKIPELDVISPAASASPSTSRLSHGTRREADSDTSGGRGLTNALVDAFFEIIHADFPVLHESSFREAYERWLVSPSMLDPPWLLSFLCLLILARRVAPNVAVQPEQVEEWQNQVHAILPSVLLTASVPAVQALLLFALHLHNTNNRDACWILTGSAIRISFAVGLHRDGIGNLQTPLMREVRKRVWWTLCSFEQMQVSSHDRPSSIENDVFSVGCPKESILDLGGKYPPDYMLWSNKLVNILGQACRALRAMRTTPAVDAYVGPLSLTAQLLRDLDRWSSTLPGHLSMNSVDVLPLPYQRPLLLLHLQYHYIVSLVSRSALLSRVASLSRKSATETLPPATVSAAELCVFSGRTSSNLTQKLDAINKSNDMVWWDVYFNYSATLVLVLSIICDSMSGDEIGVRESRRLLEGCAGLAEKQLRNSMIPGTLRRWVTTVRELDSMANDFIRGFQEQFNAGTVNEEQAQQQDGPYTMNQNESDRTYQTSTNTSLLQQAVPENARTALNIGLTPYQAAPVLNSPQYGVIGGATNTFAPWTQLQFTDLEDAASWGEVHWDDISNMLLGAEQNPVQLQPDYPWRT